MSRGHLWYSGSYTEYCSRVLLSRDPISIEKQVTIESRICVEGRYKEKLWVYKILRRRAMERRWSSLGGNALYTQKYQTYVSRWVQGRPPRPAWKHQHKMIRFDLYLDMKKRPESVTLRLSSCQTLTILYSQTWLLEKRPSLDQMWGQGTIASVLPTVCERKSNRYALPWYHKSPPRLSLNM
jgi:hypothetical protein